MCAILLPDPQATEAFGAMLATRVRPGDVITLEGALGEQRPEGFGSLRVG